MTAQTEQRDTKGRWWGEHRERERERELGGGGGRLTREIPRKMEHIIK